MSSASYSLLRTARDRIGLTEAELAQVIGSSRSHVQAVCQSKYNEYLNASQMRALLAYVRLFRDEVIEAVAEMEVMG